MQSEPGTALAGLDPETRAELLASAQLVTLPAGSVLFQPGDLCAQFPIVLAGCIKVTRFARSGREMLLYRVAEGETCIMTTACLISSEHYAACGTVEEEVRAAVLPKPLFEGLMERSAGFRRLVFNGYAGRILSLMQRIEALSDVPVDARLAARLLEMRGASGAKAGALPTTHQSLAEEIGSAREVVSRTLQRMEAGGLVRLGRGAIEIRDLAALRALAERD